MTDPTDHAGKPRPRRRRALLWGTVAVAASLVAWWASVVLPDTLARWAFARLEADWGIVGRAAQVELDPVALQVRARGLSFAAVGAEGEPFLEVEAVTVDLPWSIVRGAREVESVVLVAPVWSTHSAMDGVSNFPDLPAADPAPSTVPEPTASGEPWRLRALSVERAALSWVDDVQGLAVRADSVDLLLGPTGDGGQDATGRLTVSTPTRVVWGESETVVEPFSTALTLRSDAVAIGDLSMALPEGGLTVSGDVRFGALFALSLDYGLELDLATLPPWAPSVDGLNGALRVTGRIDGPPADPTVSARLESTAVGWGGLEFGDLDAALRVGEGRLTVEALRATLAGGTLEGAGSVAPADDGTSGAVRLSWANVNADRLSAAVWPTRPAPIASIVAGEADVAWSGHEPSGLTVSVESRHTRVTGAVMPIDGRWRFDASGGGWRLDVEPLSVGGVGLRGSLRGETPTGWSAVGAVPVDGRLDAQVRDLRRLGVELAALGLSDALATIDPTGSGSVTIGVSGPLSALTFHGELAANGTVLGTEDQLDVQASVVSTEGGWRADDIDLRVGSSTLQATGSLEDGTLTGVFFVGIPELAELDTLLPSAWGASGALEVNGTLGGTPSTPTVAASVVATDLRVAGQHVSALNAEVQASLDEVMVESLALHQDDGRLDASGRFEPATGRYSLSLVGRDLRVAPASVGDAGSVATTIDLEFTGDGSVDDPRGSGRIVLRDLVYGDRVVDRVDNELTLAEGEWRLRSGAPTFAATSELTIAPGPPWRYQFNASFSDTDLARLVGVATDTVDVVGALSATVTAQGSLRELDASTGTVSVERLDASISDTLLQLVTPVRVAATADGLRLDDPLDLRVGATRVGMSGGLLSGGGLAVTATATGDLRDLRQLVGDADGAAGLDIAGPFRLDARVAGSVQRPTVTASLSVDDGVIGGNEVTPVTALSLRAAYDAAGLTLSRLEGRWLDATVSAEAQVPASVLAPYVPEWLFESKDQTGPASLNASVVGLAPVALTGFVDPGTLQELSGEIGFEVALEADRAELADLRGAFTLTTLDLQAAGLPVTQQQPTRFTLTDERVTVERFAWQFGSSANTVTLGGHVDLSPEATADLTVTGTADLSVLNVFSRAAAGSGSAYLVANIGGTFDEPSIDGVIELSDGDVRVVEPRLLVSDVNGALVFQGTTMQVTDVTGTANGGPVQLQGEIRFPGFRPVGELTLTGRQMAIVLPPGLRTELDTDLVLTLAPDDTAVTGTVAIVRGDYREPVNTAGGLLALLEAPADVVLTEERSVLDDVRLNVRVLTRDEIVVSNNYAVGSLSADTRLVGTIGRPGVTGRLTVGDGGQLYLGGNAFEIETGTIDLIDPDGVTPQLDVTARTRVGSEEITIALEGTADTLKTSMRSSGELPESDIVSLLLTGRTLEQVGRAPGVVARDRALGLVSGEVLGAAGRTVGLDTVRLDQGSTEGNVRFDPSLVAGDTNPGTRLTVGKNLSRQVELVASQNLRQTGLITWIVNYLPRRNVELRLVVDDQTDRSYEFRHALTFGTSQARVSAGERRQEPRVSVVRLSVSGDFQEPELARLVRLKAGDRFDFLRWQDGRDRIEQTLWDRGYQEAQVRPRRAVDASANTVELTYDVRTGPRSVLEVRGYEPPARLRRQMEAAWRASVFDAFLLDELALLTRRYLVSEGLLRASVSARVDERSDALEKRLTVDVEVGPRSDGRVIRFAGQAQVPASRLERLVTPEREADAWVGGGELVDAVVRAYRADGWLAASATLEAPEFDGDQASLTITIDEGPRFHVSAVEVEDAHHWTADQVRAAAGVQAGDLYRAGLAENMRATLLAAYRAAGFSDVRVRVSATTDAASETVGLTVMVQEGRRQLLRGVEVDGAPRTNPALVKRALRLEPGTPVDPAAWNQARKRLYDTGVFRSVDITAVPVEEVAGADSGGTDQPVVARVALEEWPLYRLRYGLQVIDEQAPAGEADSRGQVGVVADLTRQNLFGRGITLGTAARSDTVQQAGRGFMVFPTFLGQAIKSNLFLSQLRETFGSAGNKTISQRRRLTLEQQLKPQEGLTLSYSYNFERNHTFAADFDPNNPFAFDLTVDVARLSTSAVMERRDDLFDATRGWFHASTLEWGVERLGSDLRFVKYLGQLYYFRSLPRGVVLASAGRVGLGRGFGQQLIPSERFFAGGGTTVRGYLQDALGPVNFFGDASGGAASVVFNQEMRFPLFAMFRGVSFLDAGNVFDSVSDVALRKLKVGVGFGLRSETPIGLIRVDYGMPVSRGVDDPRGRWFFSIGQAF